jgi:uncharacterized protein
MARYKQQGWTFYGRVAERQEIARILSARRFFFCAISGRRRIGKTTLIREALAELRDGRPTLYVQIPDSDERGVVQTFRDAIEDSGLTRMVQSRGPERINDLADIKNFNTMARGIASLCRGKAIVVLDEFQYFHRKPINPFASHLQAQVDRLRLRQNRAQAGGIFVLGSIHTEMTAILENRDYPLFNRVTHRLELGHWDFRTLFEMFAAHGIQAPPQQLFLWTLFEGVPKFYRDAYEQSVLVHSATREKTLRRLFFEGTSPLRDEAANWFLRELRGKYDSVLKLLARIQPCSYGQLVAAYGEAVPGGDHQLWNYLNILGDRYRMVEALKPIFDSEKGRKSRYVITDNFLSAWLAALSRNVDFARIRPIEEAIARADIQLQTYEGLAFEKMVRLLTEELSRSGKGDLALSHTVKGYWNKADGADIQIDLVAADNDEGIVRFGSCKRSSERFTSSELTKLSENVGRFMTTREGARFANYEAQLALYSPDFDRNTRRHLEAKGYLCISIGDFARLLSA